MALITNPTNALLSDLLIDVSQLFNQTFTSQINRGDQNISAESKRLGSLLFQPVKTTSNTFGTAKSFLVSKGANDETAATFALLVLNIAKITGKSALSILQEVDASGLSFTDETFKLLNSIRDRQSKIFGFVQTINVGSFNRNVQYFYKTGPNYPPEFTSTPITTGTEETLYTYNITAVDINGDNLRFINTSGLPSWLTLVDNGNETATLSGTPGSGDAGMYNIDLQVNDLRTPSLTDTQSFAINISANNQAPSFTSTPELFNTAGFPYTYNITTTDPNVGDTLTITADTIPSWLILVDNGNGTATLSGTAGIPDIGPNPVTLRVTDDGVGMLFALQPFTITVSGA